MGNPTSYRGHSLEWGRIRLLTKWDNTEMEYNANGIRTRKGDTYYELDGSTVISETTCGDTIRYYYGNGGIVGFRYNGSRYYYEKNLMGDIVGIYNESGNKVGGYTYDAWGNCTITANINNVATVNPFRYRGYYYDADLGLYYLESRYYDAQVGRFINADEIEYLGANEDLFAYCENNPIERIDYDGCFWEELQAIGQKFVEAAVVTAAVGGAVLLVIGAVGGTVVSGGAGAIAIPAAVVAAAECLAIATATVAAAGATAAAAGQIGSNVTYSKASKTSGKEGATNKPSWVNSSDVDPNLSAQQNAENILDNKYGQGNWKKGPETEYNQIVKWINRHVFK